MHQSSRETIIVQLCRKCGGLVNARRLETFENGMILTDRSECQICGTILWNWNRKKSLADHQRDVVQ